MIVITNLLRLYSQSIGTLVFVSSDKKNNIISLHVITSHSILMPNILWLTYLLVFIIENLVVVRVTKNILELI